MIPISTKIAERLTLCNAHFSPSSSSLRGVARFGLVQLRQSSRRFGRMRVWNLENCDVNMETSSELGIVRRATEANAQEAIEALKAGKVIAVPTDTLYGFACDACSMEAVNRIYEIKGRKHKSPLAICVGDVSDIKRFAITNHLPHGLLDCLLPGPVTVVVSRGSTVVELIKPGKYKILRAGSAKEETIAILERHALLADDEMATK